MAISSTNTENVTDASLLPTKLTGGCSKCIMNLKKKLKTFVAGGGRAGGSLEETNKHLRLTKLNEKYK